MNIEQLRDYCVVKKGVTEEFPFDEVTLVFKVMGKMFVLIGLQKWEEGETAVNLKCNPDWSEELRGEYESIHPGFHWNTVVLNSGDVSDALVRELIDHSYNLVVEGLTKKLREELKNL